MIISVDMGFKNYGYSVWDKGVIDRVGILQTAQAPAKSIAEDMIRRHQVICSGLIALFDKTDPKLLVGEMPGFGSQSSKAAVFMTMASAITLTLCTSYGLKTIWHTPSEIKGHFTGNKRASKKEMMAEACKRHGWDITYKTVKDQNAVGGFRLDPLYRVMGETLPMGKFEHIADSIGAFYTAKYFHERR